MDLDLDFDLFLEKMEFVAAGGISPVRTDPDLVEIYIILGLWKILYSMVFCAVLGHFGDHRPQKMY